MGERSGLYPLDEKEHWILLPVIVKGMGDKKSSSIRMGVGPQGRLTGQRVSLQV